MKRGHLYVKPYGCLSGVFGRSQTSREPWRITCRRFVATCSYCDEKSLEVILRHWKTVFFQSGNIALNSFTNICYSFFFRLPLADAAGQAGTFGYPVIIFARIEDNLSHFMHLIISFQSMLESIPLSSSDKPVLAVKKMSFLPCQNERPRSWRSYLSHPQRILHTNSFRFLSVILN